MVITLLMGIIYGLLANLTDIRKMRHFTETDSYVARSKTNFYCCQGGARLGNTIDYEKAT